MSLAGAVGTNDRQALDMGFSASRIIRVQVGFTEDVYRVYICSAKAEGPQFSPCPSLPKEMLLIQFKPSCQLCPILKGKNQGTGRFLHSFLEQNTQNHWKRAFVTFADHEASCLLSQVQRSIWRWSLMASVLSCRVIVWLVHR